MKVVVHHLQHGTSACSMTGRYGFPSLWPEGHKWSADWGDVTCGDCLHAEQQPGAPARTKTWAERFPAPAGPAPAKPSDEHPAAAAALDAWWRARREWDDHVRKTRRAEVARALDVMESRLLHLTPEQIIARNVGASWLDGTLS